MKTPESRWGKAIAVGLVIGLIVGAGLTASFFVNTQLPTVTETTTHVSVVDFNSTLTATTTLSTGTTTKFTTDTVTSTTTQIANGTGFPPFAWSGSLPPTSSNVAGGCWTVGIGVNGSLYVLYSKGATVQVSQSGGVIRVDC